MTHPPQAAVMGRPRELPGAKANSWVLERRQWEQAKPPEAAEVRRWVASFCFHRCYRYSL